MLLVCVGLHTAAEGAPPQAQVSQGISQETIDKLLAVIAAHEARIKELERKLENSIPSAAPAPAVAVTTAPISAPAAAPAPPPVEAPPQAEDHDHMMAFRAAQRSTFAASEITTLDSGTPPIL